jgi:2-dehydropantoate 2-reductase
MTKIKILIAGIGGVGGYFGGLLANQYFNDNDVEIYFLARGANLQAIQKNGLKIIKGDTTIIAKPTLATDNASDIGPMDLIMVCTKSYDLHDIIHQLSPCINPHTIILPLLNGVDHKSDIENLLPHNTVLNGCVYIVSRLKEAGVVENSGNIQLLYFGLDHNTNEQVSYIEGIFKKANIEATLTHNIDDIVWEKFIFISPTATATTYYDMCIGELLENEDCEETIKNLIDEVMLVSRSKNITLSDVITEKTLNKLQALPFTTTSSMHTDFKNNKPQTELHALTGYIISEAKKSNIDVPTYTKTYNALLEKTH